MGVSPASIDLEERILRAAEAAFRAPAGTSLASVCVRMKRDACFRPGRIETRLSESAADTHVLAPLTRSHSAAFAWPAGVRVAVRALALEAVGWGTCASA